MINAIDLIGTWQFIRDGEQAFLHFTYTQAFDYLKDGSNHQVLRLWYSLETPTEIRFRVHPKDTGWTCGVKMAGSSLVITGDQGETICTRAHAADIPEWFMRELAG
jgi:hypothetical protein